MSGVLLVGGLTPDKRGTEGYGLQGSKTRERILGTARELVERGDGGPNMSELARAVGISRQALYLHFADRAALLVALVERVDEREDLAAGVAAVEAAPDAAAKIRTWVAMQA